jgi:hypothetical protein
MFKTALFWLLLAVPALAAPAGIDAQRLSAHVQVLASDAFEGRGPATCRRSLSSRVVLANSAVFCSD